MKPCIRLLMTPLTWVLWFFPWFPAAVATADQPPDDDREAEVDEADADVNAYLAWRKVRSRLRQERSRLGVNTVASMSAGARELGIGVRTLWRWLAVGDPPAQRRFELTDRHLYLIGDRKKVKLAYAAAVEEGLEVDYTTFWRAWNRLSHSTRVGVLKGVKAMRVAQIYGKYPEQQRNGVWQADHTKLPIWVWPSSGKSPIRPWLTVFIDVGTRIVVGWALTTRQPNSELVIATMVDGILGFTTKDGTFVGGKPRLVRFDRGADFESELITAALKLLGIIPHPCEPYSPFQKPYIERLMGTAVFEFLAGLPGIGEVLDHRQKRGYAERPETLLTFDDLFHILEELFERYNTERWHTSLDGTPVGAWQADETPIEQMVGNEDELGVVLIRRSETRVVNQSGIRFRNVDYVHAALLPYRKKVRRRGVPVPIGFVEHDPTFLWAYDPDTLRPICRATPAGDLSPEEIRKLTRARDREVATVRRIRLGAKKLRESHGTSAQLPETTSPPPKPPRPRAVGTTDSSALNAAFGDPERDPLFNPEP